MSPLIGSLFSGYGGLDLAAHAVLGGRVVWHSDVKPASVALLAHRHPEVPNLGDLTAIDFRDVAPIDVLTAGWPCQPHSAAGKRLGEADPRALWPHVARAIGELRPAVFLGENVARIVSNGELRRVVRSLAEIGYVGAYRTLRASDVGAPHRRDRCFVVAYDAAADPGRGRLPEHPQRDRGALPGERPAPRGLDAVRRDPRGPDRLTLLPTPTQNMTTGPGTSGRDGGLNLQTAAALLPTPSASNYGTNRDRLTTWGDYGDAVRRWEHLLGRPAPEPTIPSLRTGAPQLAPRFVEWMMGLPAGWVTDVPGLAPRVTGERNAMLSLLGDGVVPQQAAAAFAELLDELAPWTAGAAA